MINHYQVARGSVGRPEAVPGAWIKVQKSKAGVVLFILMTFLAPDLAPLSCESADATNALPQLAPPYGTLPSSFWEQHGTGTVFAALGVLVLVILGICIGRRPGETIFVAPAAQARAAIEALRGQPDDGARLSRVSQILRKYFVMAFHLSPNEMTTAEFCRELAACERMDAELARSVGNFLRECDARKFAPPGSEVSFDALDRAWELVRLGEIPAKSAGQSTTRQDVASGVPPASPSKSTPPG